MANVDKMTKLLGAGVQAARMGLRSRVQHVEASSTARLAGTVRLSNKGTMSIGPRTLIDGRTGAVIITCERGAEIVVGEHCFFNYGVDLHARRSIRMGDRVLLGPYVSIADNQGHQVDVNDDDLPKPIVLGDNVWIGRFSIVLPGVSIGDGAVIGAGSVVTKDIEPGVLAVGSPARVLRALDLPDGWRR